MKQFQIKLLQQAKLDDSASVEDTHLRQAEIQPRTSASASPDKHTPCSTVNQDWIPGIVEFKLALFILLKIGFIGLLCTANLYEFIWCQILINIYYWL